MTLPLLWKRVENGLWAAGPYVLRRRRTKGAGWRISKGDDVYWGGASSLALAKSKCVADYATAT